MQNPETLLDAAERVMLYAGGLKSKADVLELLTRNPEADINEIRSVCNRYRLRGLTAILRELKSGSSS